MCSYKHRVSPKKVFLTEGIGRAKCFIRGFSLVRDLGRERPRRDFVRILRIRVTLVTFSEVSAALVSGRGQLFGRAEALRDETSPGL